MRLVDARAKRDKPGLAPQHLAAVRAVAAVCHADTEGLALGATTFAFLPRMLKGGTYRFDIGTAGSITLVLQALLPVLVASQVQAHVVVTGGTDVRQAPPADYLAEVLARHLVRMGASLRLTIPRRGYYPRGGGEIAAEIAPGALHASRLSEPGALRQWQGVAHVAHLPGHIAERMRSAVLTQFAGFRTEGQIMARVLGDAEAIGQGGAIVAWAETEYTVLGAARVAERGVRAETLGEGVGRELRADLEAGATADVHAADQLLIYLALARGESSLLTREFTSHAQTAMWLISRFLPAQFAVEEKQGLFEIRVMP